MWRNEWRMGSGTSHLSEWMGGNELSPYPKKIEYVVKGRRFTTSKLDLLKELKLSDQGMEK